MPENFVEQPVEPLSWTRGENNASPLPATVPEKVSAPSVAEKTTGLPDAPATTFDQHKDRERFHPLVEQVSTEFGLDADLLHAMIRVESNYQHEAVSPKGARGLMQVMPATGERFGYTDLLDPQHNLRAGASYMQWLIKHFDNDLTLALAGYNAGEGAVKRYGRTVPPYRETQQYVEKVMAHYKQIQPQYQSLPAGKQYAMRSETVEEKPVEKVAINGHALASKLLGLLLSTPSAATTRQQSSQEPIQAL
ncbi:lytic transglycosylase domain-containing protein [Winslowiella iniecta]|uniref:lytic transglycosylase domain-containing protein n=1 Tax=Winslowiella iniecta TaxID=1560201 RepID=UPI00069D6A8C|nr:lytic transglycosylase domain-containing protein [Winslowiella iniecta]